MTCTYTYIHIHTHTYNMYLIRRLQDVRSNDIEIDEIHHHAGIMRIDFKTPLEASTIYELRIPYRGKVRSLPYGLFYVIDRNPDTMRDKWEIRVIYVYTYYNYSHHLVDSLLILMPARRNHIIIHVYVALGRQKKFSFFSGDCRARIESFHTKKN